MNSNPIDEIALRMSELIDSGSPGIEGASGAEIDDVEQYAGETLPVAYRRFLTAMGKSAGSFFRGSDCLVSQPHGLKLRGSAIRIIERSDADYELPTDVFVFLVHHGYQFLFFPLNQNDDPPVFRFDDGSRTAEKIADSFTQFLRSRITNHEELQRRREAVETTAG